MPRSYPLPLDAPVAALPIGPGVPVVVRGVVVSRFDGVEVDAATTRWPAEAPGGPSVDALGLVDFAAGGLEVTALDPSRHEVTAVSKPGAVAPLCARHGTTTPCLVLRTRALAHARLLTEQEWIGTLRGEVTVELSASSVALAPSPGPDAVGSALRAVGLSAASIALLLLLAVVAIRLRRAAEPVRRVRRLVRAVRRAARSADPILAELLEPALVSAARAVRRRRIDPCSVEGRRLERALDQLRTALRERASMRQADAERRLVDDLAFDVEVALDAAAEASARS